MHLNKLNRKVIIYIYVFFINMLCANASNFGLDEEKNTSHEIAEFDLGLTGSESLGYAHLKGNVLCALPRGSFPQPDLENIQKAEKGLLTWAVNIKLLQEESKYYKKFQGNFAPFSAFFAPNLKFTDPQMDAFMLLAAFYFVFDDIVDNVVDHRETKSLLTASDLENVVNKYINLFKGNPRLLPDVTPVENFPLYVPLSKCILDFQEKCSESIPEYQNIRQFFLQDMEEYLKWVIATYNESGDSNVTEESYLFMRRYFSGAAPTFEFVALMNGINLQEDMRNNNMFKKLKETALNIISITNDIFSLKKEIKNNESGNFILVKVLQSKLPLDEAFRQANVFLNTEIKSFINLNNALRSAFPCDQQLHKYISSMANMIDGHLRWYEHCKRYGTIQLTFK